MPSKNIRSTSSSWVEVLFKLIDPMFNFLDKYIFCGREWTFIIYKISKAHFNLGESWNRGGELVENKSFNWGSTIAEWLRG